MADIVVNIPGDPFPLLKTGIILIDFLVLCDLLAKASLLQRIYRRGSQRKVQSLVRRLGPGEYEQNTFPEKKTEKGEGRK